MLWVLLAVVVAGLIVTLLARPTDAESGAARVLRADLEKREAVDVHILVGELVVAHRLPAIAARKAWRGLADELQLAPEKLRATDTLASLAPLSGERAALLVEMQASFGYDAQPTKDTLTDTATVGGVVIHIARIPHAFESPSLDEI